MTNGSLVWIWKIIWGLGGAQSNSPRILVYNLHEVLVTWYISG